MQRPHLLNGAAVRRLVVERDQPGRIPVQPPGGFVGVDVFFVISGYLITTILAREISEERFSLVDFYHRRIRRLFPALIVVLAVTSALAWAILMPREFRDYGRTLAWEQQLDAKLEALTLEQINAAFRRHINLPEISIVKGGDFKAAKAYE